MHSTLLSVLATAIASVSAININYYSDDNCTAYLTSAPRVPVGGTCFDYDWAGQNSANIVYCDQFADGCLCNFYTEAGCKGAMHVASTGSYGGPNCVSNYGHGFLSFDCYWHHGLKA